MTKILTDRVIEAAEKCPHESIIQTKETRVEYGFDIYICEGCDLPVSISDIGYKNYFLFSSFDGTCYYTRRIDLLKGRGEDG